LKPKASKFAFTHKPTLQNKGGKVSAWRHIQMAAKGLNWLSLSIDENIDYEGFIMSEMTTEILEQNIGKIVLVRLKGGKSLRGRLKGFDQHLNLVLEETEDTTNVESQRKLGLIIVRGDNVVLISPPPR